jgi:hypothetical protein
MLTENLCTGKSSCNVRALTYCDLHKIMRDDLLEVSLIILLFYISPSPRCHNIKYPPLPGPHQTYHHQ